MAEGNEPRPYSPTRTFSVTVNTDKVNVDTGSVYVSGTACICNLRLVSKESITGSDIMVSGMPKPHTTIKFAICKNNGNNIAGYVNTSGEIHNDWGTISANEGFFINVVYPTND